MSTDTHSPKEALPPPPQPTASTGAAAEEPTPSLAKLIFGEIKTFCQAMRCGPGTSPEAASEWAKLEKEFDERRNQ